MIIIIIKEIKEIEMKKIKLFVMLLLSFALVACGAKVEKNTDTTVKETVKEEKNFD